jgi:8-oxo-dGTP diphosphatase
VIGAATIIVDDSDHVLLVKHSYGDRNWELPGGRGETGESAEETARREAREEVGLELDDLRLTGVYWEPFVDMHHFVFRARAAEQPRVADKNEITDVGWFSRDALPRPISDFTIRRIEDALAGRPPAVTAIGPRVWLR